MHLNLGSILQGSAEQKPDAVAIRYGDLAIRYGYQRFETSVMIAVIIVLIALVSLVQAIGDRIARLLDHR